MWFWCESTFVSQWHTACRNLTFQKERYIWEHHERRVRAFIAIVERSSFADERHNKDIVWHPAVNSRAENTVL